jgi:AcrR family transcriptional regulator
MPKVNDSYLDARRAQILDAAIICFARQGFHRATMRDIVEQSKLSAGAIYNYFRSKEDMIEAIAKERHRKEKRLVLEAQRESNFACVVGRIRDAFLGELRNRRERLRRRVSIQLWAEAQRNPRIKKIVGRGVTQMRKLLSGIISDAQRRHEVLPDLDPDAVARFMIAAFQGFALQMEWDNDILVDPYMRVLDTFLKPLFLLP